MTPPLHYENIYNVYTVIVFLDITHHPVLFFFIIII
jgi:hypothetical protein